MRKIREVLSLKRVNHLSTREIARSYSISRSTAADYLDRAQRVGLSWPISEECDDTSLERLLYSPVCCVPLDVWHMPDFDDIYQELKKKGVTLQLLWCEYKQAQSRKHPEQGFPSCLGIMRLAKQYSTPRLEAVCAKALGLKAYITRVWYPSSNKVSTGRRFRKLFHP